MDMSDAPKNASLVSRSALTLGFLVLAGTALLSWVYNLAEPRIAEQERQQLLRQLEQVLPASAFNNAMHEDYTEVEDPVAFPGRQIVRIYRARLDDHPAAVVMKVSAPDGYNGTISLLVGVYENGEISGVRVLGHNETPGLGDGIELARSDWILDFDNKSLTDPSSSGWAVKRDGGEFDQFTGATITPRAIVRAVHRALQYFEANKPTLFQSESLFEEVLANNGSDNE